ncbi:hypothetical protein GDO78_023325 [Eleutherodactylus coqui]|uniref:Uncharacterized protein n=1 Tax=Eleutherodactylus coqui TaxID=57060 RepID=A0A8J6EFR1_ELECQ|nr:hypothetical protein GDO78_023325 [Eleutherodactylus coqui]
MEFILTDTRITLWLKPQSRRLETLVCNGTRDPVMAAHEDTSVRRKILCLPSGWRTSPQMPTFTSYTCTLGIFFYPEHLQS